MVVERCRTLRVSTTSDSNQLKRSRVRIKIRYPFIY